MSHDILDDFGSATDLTITLASLAHISMRQSAQIAIGDPSEEKCLIHGKFKTGGGIGNPGQMEFYIARANDGTPELRDGGTGTSDAAYTGDRNQLEIVYNIQTEASGNQTYEFSFLIDPPGVDFVLVMRNRTQAALSSTAADHKIRYRLFTPQIQD